MRGAPTGAPVLAGDPSAADWTVFLAAFPKAATKG